MSFIVLRRIGGLATALILLAYIFHVLVARVTGLSVSAAADEYAAMTLTDNLIGIGFMTWLAGSVAYGFGLLFDQVPYRKYAAALILLEATVFYLASQSRPPASEPSLVPDLLAYAVLFAPPLVQLLDIVLPPWPSGKRQPALDSAGSA